MKRFALALGLLAMGAPAMAGGLEGGVKNSYFTNFNSETVNYGERNIHVESLSEVTWGGKTESHKSFEDFMGKVSGVEGHYEASRYWESSEVDYDQSGHDGHEGGKDKDKDKGGWRSSYGGGDKGSYTEDLGQFEELNVSFEDPKVQLTWSEGWTNTKMSAEGFDQVATNVNIYEEYEGYSESMEHGHEATSFASAF